MARWFLALCVAFVGLVSTARADPLKTAHLTFVPGPGATNTAEALAQGGETDWMSVMADLGRDVDANIEVRVALDESTFRSMLPPSANVPAWAAGVAFPKLKLAVLRISPSDNKARGILRHELSHVAVGILTGDQIPHWFLEGLATIRAGDAWERKGPSLVQAALSEGLFSFDHLAETFPTRPADAELAYAQSADFVQFLVDRSGEASVPQALREVVNGASFDVAMMRVYGATPRVLENEWRRSLARWEILVRFMTGRDLLWTAITFLFLIAAWRMRQRRQAHLRYMEQEEHLEALRALAHAPAVDADALHETPIEDTIEPEEQSLVELAVEANNDETTPKKPTLH